MYLDLRIFNISTYLTYWKHFSNVYSNSHMQIFTSVCATDMKQIMHVNDHAFSLALQTVEMVKGFLWLVFDLAQIFTETVLECDVSAFKAFGLNYWDVRTGLEAADSLFLRGPLAARRDEAASPSASRTACQWISPHVCIAFSSSPSAVVSMLSAVADTHTEWPFIVQMCMCVWGKPLRSLPNACVFFPSSSSRSPSVQQRERLVRLPWFPDMRRKHNDSLCETHTTFL